MNKKKILNDPVYGFINIPHDIIFDLIEHKAFQRLRRIRQTGLSDFVYPGALHTRFHHALGAMHLMQQAIAVLRSKGTTISTEESRGASIAILLHDVGHGPFSHALEHTLLKCDHESLSLAIMQRLNEEFNGALSLAIAIFTNQYSKKFLHQLVSSQLDMDRMDYLNRDSFFTGVAEGKIGYDRIIKMLAVVDDELVVEEKGIYSIEKFLIARRLMYWQVYLHKAVLSAEHMLIHTLRRAQELTRAGEELPVSEPLKFFLRQSSSPEDTLDKGWLEQYYLIDDIDVMMALKNFCSNPDHVLSLLANGLINRKLFRVELRPTPFEEDYISKIQKQVIEKYRVPLADLSYLVVHGKESNRAYDDHDEEIKIKFKSGDVLPISQVSDIHVYRGIVEKHFLFYPK
jgi:HD superfamily phosphohydrolase